MIHMYRELPLTFMGEHPVYITWPGVIPCRLDGNRPFSRLKYILVMSEKRLAQDGIKLY